MAWRCGEGGRDAVGTLGVRSDYGARGTLVVRWRCGGLRWRRGAAAGWRCGGIAVGRRCGCGGFGGAVMTAAGEVGGAGSERGRHGS